MGSRGEVTSGGDEEKGAGDKKMARQLKEEEEKRGWRLSGGGIHLEIL